MLHRSTPLAKPQLRHLGATVADVPADCKSRDPQAPQQLVASLAVK
jgi:hypothetical protein